VKRFGLIGFPLTHSFSRKYFTEKFEQEGLTDHVYDLFPISSIEELPAILKNNSDLQGLNVTIPYKQLVMQYLNASQIPVEVEACNCIKIENGILTGYNTDITGFEKSFTSHLRSFHERALVLGNGGATAAVTYVLRKLRIPYHIVSRKIHDGSSLTYDDLDQAIIKEHQIIINTTPLGTYPDVHVSPPIPYEWITPQHYLFDLVYNPSKTLFLQKRRGTGSCNKKWL
jgi:shikimate dehydrogenase